MTQKFPLLLGISTAILALGCVHLWRQLDVAQAEAASATQARLEAERRLEAFRQRMSAAEPAFEPSSLSDTPTESQATAATGPENQSSRQTSQPRRGRDNDPAEVLGEDMIATLKLNDSTAQAMARVVRDERQRLRQSRNESTGSLADQNTLDMIRDETDRRLRELLGDEKFAELQEYKKYAAEYERLGRLDRRLARDGMPTLSESQRISLLAAMKQIKTAAAPPTASQFQTQKEFQLAYQAWRASQEQRTQQWAATILTPEQLQRFNTQRRGQPPPPRY